MALGDAAPRREGGRRRGAGKPATRRGAPALACEAQHAAASARGRDALSSYAGDRRNAGQHRNGNRRRPGGFGRQTGGAVRVDIVKTFARINGPASTTALIEYVATLPSGDERGSKVEAQKVIDERSKLK